MNFNLTLFKLALFVALSCSVAAVINQDNENVNTNMADLQTSATSAKLLNLASLFGNGNTGYHPNYNRPGGYYPNYGYNTNGGYYPSVGKYPATNVGSYYPNSNYYPTTGTNVLGAGYGGYGGYGGNGGLRQYYGYWDPNYAGQRNMGYGYYSNTNRFGLPTSTGDQFGSRERDRVQYTFRGYD